MVLFALPDMGGATLIKEAKSQHNDTDFDD